MGGLAIAHDFATGAIAHAGQVNNETTAQFFQSNLFFHGAEFVSKHSILLNLIWVVPMIVQWWVIAKKSHEQKLTNR